MTTLSETTLLAFVDGELDVTTAEQVGQQLAHDHTAADTVRALRSSAALVRAAFPEAGRETVPADLVALVAGRRGWRRLAGRRQFTAALGASIAACAAGVAGGIALERPFPKQAEPAARLLAEVAEYHTGLAGEASRLAIVPASKAATIESWFSALLKRRMQIPDLAGFGLTFQGARIFVVHEHPVAQFLYAAPGEAGRPLGVCVTAWPGPKVPLRTEESDGVALALWAQAGYAYVLVGWVRPALLKSIAAVLGPKLEEA